MSTDPKTRSNRFANLISTAQEPAPAAAEQPTPRSAVAAEPAPVAAPKRGRRKAAPAPRTLEMKSRDHAMSTIVWRQDVDELELKLLLLGRELGSKRRIAVSALLAGLLNLAAKDDDLMRRAANVILTEES